MSGCPHGFAKPSQCVDCMMDGPVAPPEVWNRVGDLFTAQFPGECPCGDEIEEGQQIQRWDLGAGRTVYTHEGCSP